MQLSLTHDPGRDARNVIDRDVELDPASVAPARERQIGQIDVAFGSQNRPHSLRVFGDGSETTVSQVVDCVQNALPSRF